MTQSKHTTGPWFVINHKGTGTSIQNRKDGGGHLIAENVYKGDAALIAAAPELLAALNNLMWAVKNGNFDYEGEGAMQQASNAISKARGEQ